MFEHFWERFQAFWKIESFSGFLKFFQVSTLQGALGNFFRENYLKTSSKLVWRLSRLFLDTLENSIFFDFFFQVLQISISRLHWARKIRKNYLKQVWTLLITFFGILNFWSLFDSCGFFWVSRVHWAELFSVEIIKQNMPKQCFWERFRRNLKVSQFFHFFVFFASFDHPGCTGQKFLPKKLPRSMLKTCLTAFGNVFSGILNNWKFFQFFEFFPSFDPPG